MKLSEVKNVLNYLLDNNLKLVEQGQDKIAVNIVGECGIGKTALFKSLAEERGANFVRLDIGALEETGDLLGFPIKTYTMTAPDGTETHVAEKLIDQFLNMGYKICPDCEPIMSYSKPEWVPEDEDTETILLIDDYSRKN